jgi:hypothetical protein
MLFIEDIWLSSSRIGVILFNFVQGLLILTVEELGRGNIEQHERLDNALALS